MSNKTPMPGNELEQPKSIDKMTLTELQALCYTQIMLMTQTQNNINLLQAEINKRGQEPAVSSD